MMVEAPEIRKTAQHTPTNTLVITKVPPALLHSAVTPSLKEFFERYGRVEAWVPLTGFERVVVVYGDETSVEAAKEAMDHTLVEGFGDSSGGSRSILRVYRANPTPLESLGRNRFPEYLPVPDTDKNFLISPPGSPPVGWEQIREDPPNADTLAADLAKALEGLAVDRFSWPEEEDVPAPAIVSPASPARLRSPRDTLIIPHRRTESGDLPSVMVSDTEVDSDAQKPFTNGLTIAEAFEIQRRPPGSISRVKATVESMQDSAFQFPAVSQRIDRTPRPPLGP